MSEVSAVRIPPYNFNDVSLWFAMCEHSFELAHPRAITESRTKFNYISANLPPEAASVVRDLIIKRSDTTPYEDLKTQLIKRTSDSSQSEIRKLLSGEQLGDRKPSDLLRVMQRRAESHKVSNELMLELFLSHLPSHVQSILASISPLSLDKASEVADRILEYNPAAVNAVSVPSNSNSEILCEIKKLNDRIKQLELRRSRSPFRRHSFERSRSSSKDSKQFCWYHKRFGKNARKCSESRSFSKNTDSEV